MLKANTWQVDPDNISRSHSSGGFWPFVVSFSHLISR